MNKDLDKKLKLYIANMAIVYTPFGLVWNSSAKKLEDDLLARGVNFPQKLYYEYKMPDGLSQKDFMDKLVMAEFFDKFYSRYAPKILVDRKLSMSDKAKIFGYVWNKRGEHVKELEKYESEIKRLNSELANIKTRFPSDVVYGATFGFAPEEIKYFAGVRDFDYETKLINLQKV